MNKDSLEILMLLGNRRSQYLNFAVLFQKLARFAIDLE